MLVGQPHFPLGADGAPQTGWPPGPSGWAGRQAAHPLGPGSSRILICGGGKGAMERVAQRGVPRETTRPCGRRAAAGAGSVRVGLPHFSHGAGGSLRAFRLLSRRAECRPRRNPCLGAPSGNDLCGSAEACGCARGRGGSDREGSRTASDLASVFRVFHVKLPPHGHAESARGLPEGSPQQTLIPQRRALPGSRSRPLPQA